MNGSSGKQTAHSQAATCGAMPHVLLFNTPRSSFTCLGEAGPAQHGRNGGCIDDQGAEDEQGGPEAQLRKGTVGRDGRDILVRSRGQRWTVRLCWRAGDSL